MTQLLISKLASLMLLFLLGFLFGKRRLLSEETVKGLAWLILDVLMAALFFSGIVKQGIQGSDPNYKIALISGLLVPLCGLGLALPISKFLNLKPQQNGVFLFLSCIGNSSFLPLPLAYALWGEAGALACLLYVLTSNAVLFGLGIALLKHGKIDKNADFAMAFKHPQALAFYLGILIFALGIPVPAWVLEPAEALGKATLPLSMLVVGAILAQSSLAEQGRGSVVKALSAVVVLKLVLLPALALAAIKFFNLQGFAAGLLLLQAAMPSLASTGVYAKRFGGDAGLGARGSLITTLLCPLTLPFWMNLWF